MKCNSLRLILLLVILVIIGLATILPTQAFATKHFSNSPDSLSTVYNNQGVDYAMAGDYEKAGELFLKSLHMLQKKVNADSVNLGIGFFNLANLKMLLGYSDSALVYYQMAANYYGNLPKNRSNLSAVYIGMGSCYYSLNEYREATSFIRQGIALLRETAPLDYHRLVLANYKLCNVLTKMGQYDEAIKINSANLKIARFYAPSMRSIISNGLGVTSSHLKSFKQTLYFYKQAEQFATEKVVGDNDELASIYNNIGVLYKENADWINAEKYLQKALECYKAGGSSNPIPTVQVLVNLASVKDKLGFPADAVRLYNLASGLNKKPSSISDTRVSKVSMFFSPALAASIYEGLGDTYLELNSGKFSNENTRAALASYEHAIRIVEEIRLGFFGEEDKLSVSADFNEVFNKAVAAAYQLGAGNHNLELGFRLASKGKAAVLSESLNRLNSLSVSGVPAKLQKDERQLRQRIGLLTEIVYEEQKKAKPAAQYLKTVENSLFEAQQSYRSLLQSIKVNYPSYFSLKFDTTAVSISQVQERLNYHQVYVEYVLQDSSIYTFTLTKSNAAWNFQKLDKTFFSNLKTFQRQLVPSDFGKLTRLDLDSLAAAGYDLYQKLLQPSGKLIEGKELIIVPHNELNSVPFDALIVEKVLHPNGYYDLPYLITRNSVLYAMSSKVFVTGDNPSASFFPSSLSVAPTYTGASTTRMSTRAAYRNNLAELYGAEDEVREVSHIFNGDVLAGKDATERKFKEISSRYDILHLAMHTYVDSENPLFSKLIFFNSPDTSEDGYLNAYEVYNMRLKARLAILSACRSGDGNLVRGEGLMSIARGFRYAGCPSLVVTQWRVDDYSGGEIVKDFALNLKSGYSKSEALRDAQLSFLASADPLRSHPYFWAGYQVVGVDAPLFIPFGFLVIPLLVLIMALAQLLVSWRSRGNYSFR
ncbi:MAG TPA: CHAT domain-containing tetratricopeptide repeat protein [Williamwhitmania sp.]|nr:CHAT domain-containing tetratricopeptide repeat protein [Williamwhitmania sp.]